MCKFKIYRFLASIEIIGGGFFVGVRERGRSGGVVRGDSSSWGAVHYGGFTGGLMNL